MPASVPAASAIEYVSYSSANINGKKKTVEKHLKAVRDRDGTVHGEYSAKESGKPKVTKRLSKSNLGKYIGGMK